MKRKSARIWLQVSSGVDLVRHAHFHGGRVIVMECRVQLTVRCSYMYTSLDPLPHTWVQALGKQEECPTGCFCLAQRVPRICWTCTLHVIIIPGVQMWDENPPPPGQPKMTLSNFECMEMVDMVITIDFVRANMEKCKQCFQRPDLGLRWGFDPLGQLSRKGECSRRAGFSIPPSGVYCDI